MLRVVPPGQDPGQVASRPVVTPRIEPRPIAPVPAPVATAPAPADAAGHHGHACRLGAGHPTGGQHPGACACGRSGRLGRP